MSFYPILLDWQDVPCLIAGGGAIALHKAELLCAHGADVTVVAPAVCPELPALPVTIHRRSVTAEDVIGKRLVIDATGDEGAEELLRDACRAYGVPFNSACRVGDGTALFAALADAGVTLDRMVESVNELASERFGDILIEPSEDGYAVIGDYTEEVLRWTERR